MNTQVIRISDRQDKSGKEAARTSKSGKRMTEHAAAAKLIRHDLKKAWPTVTFSVKSHSYSGGNAVDVRWTDGPTTEQVDFVVGKYEQCTFDGMQDVKEYTNTRHDIPQVDWVQTSRNYTDDTRREAVEYVNNRYGYSLQFVYRQPTRWTPAGHWEIDTASDQHQDGDGQSARVHRCALHPQPLICDTCQTIAHVGDDYCSDCGTRLTSEHINR